MASFGGFRKHITKPPILGQTPGVKASSPRRSTPVDINRGTIRQDMSLLWNAWVDLFHCSLVYMGSARGHRWPCRPYQLSDTGVCPSKGSKRMAISPRTCNRWMPTWRMAIVSIPCWSMRDDGLSLNEVDNTRGLKTHWFSHHYYQLISINHQPAVKHESTIRKPIS